MKEVILSRLADQVRSMRIERGLSQLELAKRAGVNRKTIIELEKGAAGIAVGTIVSVLESMGGELKVVAASRPTTEEMQAMLGLTSTHGVVGVPSLVRQAKANRIKRIRLPTIGATSPDKPAGDK